MLSLKMILSKCNRVDDRLGELWLLHSMLLIFILLIFKYLDLIVRFSILDREVNVPFK